MIRVEGMWRWWIAFLGTGLLMFALDAFFISLGASEQMVYRDFNNDGRKEAKVFFQDKLITRTEFDNNRDGRPESVVYYKDGFRDHAELDTDLDGKTDVWISYYFTGLPWRRAEDLNRDGVADYWTYLKNGVLYRWEEDRNGDGKADVETIFDADHPSTAKPRKIVRQAYDNDFDGRYDSLSGTSRQNSANVPTLWVGAH